MISKVKGVANIQQVQNLATARQSVRDRQIMMTLSCLVLIGLGSQELDECGLVLM